MIFMKKYIFSFDNTKIVYDIKRYQDEFLIFLHGAGGDYSAWKKELSFFNKRKISTLAMDLRGHGYSDRPKNHDKYQLDNFAKDLKQIIDKEKINKFILVGHCFGGIVSIKFEEIFPDLAEAYVLIDTTHKLPKWFNIFFKVNSYLIKYLVTRLEFFSKSKLKHANHDKYANTGDYNLRRIYSDIAHTSLRSWLFVYNSISSFDGIKTLKKMNQEVLILEGEKDSVFNVDVAKKIDELVKNSSMKIIPDSNHIVVMSHPESVSKEIFDFIKKIKFVK